MAPRKCHFFADLLTLAVLFSFVVIGLYFSIKNANEKYGASVYVPFILPMDESHYNDVRDFFIQNKISSQESLDANGSPQNTALYWIAETDERGLKLDNPNLIQRYVLAVLYYSTAGSKWTNRDKHLADSLECAWHGVDCNNETMVVNVSLASNNLVGNLPSEIASLESLQNLKLNNNKLKGNFIDDALCNNTKLETLDVSNNELSGGIPFFSETCEDLISLKLSKNSFTGTLNSDINKLTKLKHLDLNMNKLSGPVNIFNLKVCNELLLGGNKFNESLPSNIHFMGSLKQLDLFNNEFSGTIPASYQRLDNLEVFQLAGNQLTGTVSSVIGKMTKLRDLTLQYNNFTGDLPEEICAIETLSRVMADCNCDNEFSLDSCGCCTSCCCNNGDYFSCDDDV